jgi:hypothetical protein
VAWGCDWMFRNEGDMAVQLDIGDRGVSLALASGRIRSFRSDSRWFRLDFADGRRVNWGGSAAQPSSDGAKVEVEARSVRTRGEL